MACLGLPTYNQRQSNDIKGMTASNMLFHIDEK